MDNVSSRLPDGVKTFSLTLARVDDAAHRDIARRTLRLSGSEAFATFRYLTSGFDDTEAEAVVARLKASQFFWPAGSQPVGKLWKIIDVQIEFGPCAPKLTKVGDAQ